MVEEDELLPLLRNSLNTSGIISLYRDRTIFNYEIENES